MVFWGLLRNLLLAVCISCRSSAAEFTSSFDYAIGGSDMRLTWDAVAPHYYPLYITAQLIDKSADGTKATGYKANITVSATGNTFLWTGIPYPLRWIQSGLYQLELHPSTLMDHGSAVLARSPFFRIQELPSQGDSSPPPRPTLIDYQGETNTSGVNKPLAIGLGVAIGIPSVVALAVVGWCFRRRYQRASLAKQRLKRSQFVID
ncbi:hypothetical protein B0H66DRAFT_599609 [Apodospora peruviana]|uniref:Uncharacterized protein n=1 Tax=Apodospora peruviana TaxID=516989 RepID=A0AAE0II72_9PEZI|nr:hypothetical protein B0H66DRAFT_599609 [Apodospora peruviana]